MNPTIVTLALASALLAVAPASAEGNCSNYGISVNTYVFSSPDCSNHNYTQYCDQGTGAGAGAGSGGTGGNAAQAEAHAGTRCTQNNGGPYNDTMSGPEFNALPTTPIVNGVTENLDSRNLIGFQYLPTYEDLPIRDDDFPAPGESGSSEPKPSEPKPSEGK